MNQSLLESFFTTNDQMIIKLLNGTLPGKNSLRKLTARDPFADGSKLDNLERLSCIHRLLLTRPDGSDEVKELYAKVWPDNPYQVPDKMERGNQFMTQPDLHRRLLDLYALQPGLVYTTTDLANLTKIGINIDAYMQGRILSGQPPKPKAKKAFVSKVVKPREPKFVKYYQRHYAQHLVNTVQAQSLQDKICLAKTKAEKVKYAKQLCPKLELAENMLQRPGAGRKPNTIEDIIFTIETLSKQDPNFASTPEAVNKVADNVLEQKSPAQAPTVKKNAPNTASEAKPTANVQIQFPDHKGYHYLTRQQQFEQKMVSKAHAHASVRKKDYYDYLVAQGSLGLIAPPEPTPEEQNKPTEVYLDASLLPTECKDLDESKTVSRDGETFACAKLALAVEAQTNMAVWNKLYAGNVHEVTFLLEAISELKNLGYEVKELRADRGFLAQYNITGMCQADVNFSIPMLTSHRLYKAVVTKFLEFFSNCSREYFMTGVDGDCRFTIPFTLHEAGFCDADGYAEYPDLLQKHADLGNKVAQEAVKHVGKSEFNFAGFTFRNKAAVGENPQWVPCHFCDPNEILYGCVTMNDIDRLQDIRDKITEATNLANALNSGTIAYKNLTDKQKRLVIKNEFGRYEPDRVRIALDNSVGDACRVLLVRDNSSTFDIDQTKSNYLFAEMHWWRYNKRWGIEDYFKGIKTGTGTQAMANESRECYCMKLYTILWGRNIVEAVENFIRLNAWKNDKTISPRSQMFKWAKSHTAVQSGKELKLAKDTLNVSEFNTFTGYKCQPLNSSSLTNMENWFKEVKYKAPPSQISAKRSK